MKINILLMILFVTLLAIPAYAGCFFTTEGADDEEIRAICGCLADDMCTSKERCDSAGDVLVDSYTREVIDAMQGYHRANGEYPGFDAEGYFDAEKFESDLTWHGLEAIPVNPFIHGRDASLVIGGDGAVPQDGNSGWYVRAVSLDEVYFYANHDPAANSFDHDCESYPGANNKPIGRIQLSREPEDTGIGVGALLIGASLSGVAALLFFGRR